MRERDAREAYILVLQSVAFIILGLFPHDLGLFLHDLGLFANNKSLFSHNLGLFAHDV